MTAMLLKQGEQLDDLLINNWKIIQPVTGFRFSLDSILLAHFAFLKNKCHAVDLGTGTGVIALLLCARGAESVQAVEVCPDMADMALRNSRLNHLSEKIQVHALDLCTLARLWPAGGYDLVVANPPYRPYGHGYLNQGEYNKQARHEIRTTLTDVIRAAAHILKFRGRFALVQRADRLTDILTEMRQAGLEPKRLRMVHSYPQRPPRLVLVEGIRGGRPGLEVLAPIYIYDLQGKYTAEICGWYAAAQERV